MVLGQLQLVYGRGLFLSPGFTSIVTLQRLSVDLEKSVDFRDDIWYIHLYKNNEYAALHEIDTSE